MKFYLSFLLISFVFAINVFAQTSGFTYQGKLTDTNAAANGQYDFTFRLFDAAVAGTQIGGIFSVCNGALVNGASAVCDNVPVTGGVFTVRLDFGASAFSTTEQRYLEISVRTGASTGAFTPLAPRQSISTAPFSIKSLITASAENAFNLGGLAADQYVVTNDFRLTDARNPLPNSPNYINNTTAPQAASNFNISGNGTVGGNLSGNVVNAATQYNLGGFRVLTMNSINRSLYGGGANSSGNNNTFFGILSGNSNTGFSNSFFGISAGSVNTDGAGNSFFGANAGMSNTSAQENSFFGYAAGVSNQTGNLNSFFGRSSGEANTSGRINTFVGGLAGLSNTTGISNTFIGVGAGASNVEGNFNTMLGYNANVTFGNLSFATAIGAGATVNRNNQIVLGRNIGQDAVFIPGNAVVNQDLSTDTFAANAVFTSQLQAGSVIVETLGAAGGTQLCRNAANQISNCSSSLRYKTNIAPFVSGLSFIKQLRPIAFDWKQDGTPDIGFGAEEVANINPMFVTYNERGEVEGVKYDRLSVVFVNAFYEQQTQIERQQKMIESQQKEIDALKEIVCSLKPDAEICKLR